MATELQECNAEELPSVVRFLFSEQKDLMQRIFIKKYFLSTVEVFVALSVSQLGSKHFADDEQVQTEAWKWLRQQSKHFYASGLNPLVKRWDKCNNVGGGYVEK
jgi:hypothetical protein